MARYVSNRQDRQFKIRVHDVAAVDGTVLDVFVGNVNVGSMTLDDDGIASLLLSSQGGDTVPMVTSGAEVKVKDEDGAVVASGRFR